MTHKILLFVLSLIFVAPSAQSQQCFPVEKTYHLDYYDYYDYAEVKNPWGVGTVLRQYANGASIAFYQKTAYYKLSQYEDWSAMAASTLDSICDCYHNAVTYGTFDAISGVATTREQYFDSEVFYFQSLASLETMYPALFPRKNRFRNVFEIFSPSGMRCTQNLPLYEFLEKLRWLWY